MVSLSTWKAWQKIDKKIEVTKIKNHTIFFYLHNLCDGAYLFVNRNDFNYLRNGLFNDHLHSSFKRLQT